MLPRTGRPQTHTSAGIWGQGSACWSPSAAGPSVDRTRGTADLYAGRRRSALLPLPHRTGGCVPTTAGGVCSRRGAVVPELLLVAGTGLPAALFPGFVILMVRRPP